MDKTCANINYKIMMKNNINVHACTYIHTVFETKTSSITSLIYIFRSIIRMLFKN